MSHYFAEAGLEPDFPTLASFTAGMTGVRVHAQLIFHFLVVLGMELSVLHILGKCPVVASLGIFSFFYLYFPAQSSCGATLMS